MGIHWLNSHRKSDDNKETLPQDHRRGEAVSWWSNILILQEDKETLTKHLKVNPLIIWPLTPPGGNTENERKWILEALEATFGGNHFLVVLSPYAPLLKGSLPCILRVPNPLVHTCEKSWQETTCTSNKMEKEIRRSDHWNFQFCNTPMVRMPPNYLFIPFGGMSQFSSCFYY